jgi:phosphoglycolate phosphatase
MIDVDGTLVDTVPDLSYCVNELMSILDRPVWSEAKVRHWIGNGVSKLVERALTGKLEASVNPVDYAKAYPIFLDLYSHNISKRSQLFSGVKAGLSYLKSLDINLGCITNKVQRFTHPLLKDLGIFDQFEIIVSGDTLAKKKPDPLPLLYSAEHFNIDPSHCLMIGDSISDIKASRNAGFDIICLSYGYNHGIDIKTVNPDLVIDSMTELSYYIS